MVFCTKRKISLISIFVVCTVEVTLRKTEKSLSKPLMNISQPIFPAEYRAIVGQGFSTNWFKTRVQLSQYKSRSRADLCAPSYDAINFTSFLGNLTIAVDKCLENGVVPSLLIMSRVLGNIQSVM